MPLLENPRHEAFAQARAKGALLNDAYERAGFVLHKGHPSRLAYRAEVAERIAELRAAQTLSEDNSPVALLAALSRIIKAGEGSEDPSMVTVARLAIVDAARLRLELEPAKAADRARLFKDISSFVQAQIRDTDPVDA
jgi:hypothetical protein